MTVRTQTKNLIRGFLHKRGFELSRVIGADLAQFLASRDVDVVLDVGANVGQFGSNLRADGYRGRIVSFEPIRSVFAQLQAEAKADPRWDTRNFALGAEVGTAEIRVSQHTVYSSILEQTELAAKFDPKAGTVSVEQISVRPLDDFFEAEFGDAKVFLKIDVQGFEPQVLRGAERSLKRILGVQLELPAVHLYRDTWDMEAAIAQMREYGFVVAQVRPVNYLANDPASIVEIDCIFRRVD
jgi:FkbM family methyltransferase